MTTLTRYSSDDPRLDTLLGSAHERFSNLVAEANTTAREFYRQRLGEALDIPDAIDRIFAAVTTEGDAAVLRYNEAFDGASLPADALAVTATEIEAAWEAVDAGLRTALLTAVEQITAYQRSLLPAGYDRKEFASLDVRWTPLERVGAYVPGGPAGSLPLCSTVLMNLVPAQVAGVRDCVAVTPPRADGSVAPELLAACKAAGISEVYKVGGVQAIAALACGTDSIPRVDKIVGPGNIFVTLAKRQAYGRVDIDMLAGPSEVLVIADGSTPADWVAADLLSQAEHDPLAMSVLVAIGADCADAIEAAVAEQLAALPDDRRAVAEPSIANMGASIVVDDRAAAATVANRFAPEHLEVLTEDPEALVADIRHAGAIFIGPWSPEPIGDYVAGPSHTLPTGGTARMWSGIGADTFLKRSSIIKLSEKEFRGLAQAGMTLARAEGLTAHERSIGIRLAGN